MALNFTIWKDMLTEKIDGSKLFSQARVYLLLSVVAYFATLTIIVAKSLRPTLTIEMDSLKTVIDALQWAILLFAGYSFGHKGIDAIKTIFGKNPSDSPDASVSNVAGETSNVQNPPVGQ